MDLKDKRLFENMSRFEFRQVAVASGIWGAIIAGCPVPALRIGLGLAGMLLTLVILTNIYRESKSD